MNNAWTALLWKEWREHRWKLAALSAITLAMLASVASESDGISRTDPVPSMLLLYVPLASLFVAMGTAASERSLGTLGLLQMLPKDLRWIATIKLTMAVLTVLIPAVLPVGILLLAAVASPGDGLVGNALDLWGGEVGDTRPGQPLSIRFTLTAAAVIVSLVIWVAALGVNRESEVRAGLIGLTAIIAVWLAWGGGLGTWYRLAPEHFETPWLLWWGPATAAALPGGLFIANTFNAALSPWRLYATFYFATHLPLACWYVFRFGKTTNAPRWSPRPAKIDEAVWLGPPMTSPLRALLWKQLRESLPLAAAGVIGAVGLVTAIGIGNYVAAKPRHRVAWQPTIVEEYGQLTVTSFVLFGFITAVVTGVGLMVNDLRPKPLAFWRSRPIDIDAWFWSRCLGGAAKLAVGFGAPAVLGLVLAGALDDSQVPSFAPFVAASVLLAFGSSLAAGSLLRHSVYTSLLAIGFALSLTGFVATKLESPAAMAATLGATAVAAILLAWASTRRDVALLR